MNILLTNSGRRTYFVEYLLNLKKKFKKIQIHLTDSNKFCATFCTRGVYRHVTAEVRKSKKYLSNILRIIKYYKINLLIPLTDRDLKILSKNKLKIEKLNCKVLISSFNLCDTFDNKIKTENFCNEK